MKEKKQYQVRHARNYYLKDDVSPDEFLAPLHGIGQTSSVQLVETLLKLVPTLIVYLRS